MEKLLHERIKDYLSLDHMAFVTAVGTESVEPKVIAKLIVDEIESQYIPRPRFENGEPLKYGDQIDYFGRAETVVSYLIAPDVREGVEYGARKPYVTLHLKSGTSYNVPLDEPLKRPAKKIIGSDGIEILENERGYNTEYDEEYTVLSVGSDDPDLALFVRNQDREEFYIDANKFTHKRPAYDADGETCVVGETLFDIETCEKLVARNVFYNNGVWFVDCGDGVNGGYDSFKTYRKAESLSHVRPDSFEKLCDDLVAYLVDSNTDDDDPICRIADRLTALIERK